MDNDQNEKQTSQSTEDDEITRKTDTGLLHKKLMAGYQRTVRIDEQPEIEGATDWGNAFLGKRAQLNLKVEGYNDSSVQVTIKDQIVVGRALPDADENPDVDLTSFDAAQLGVSRRHIMITKEGNMLKVVDLDSTNGTYLNGMQLRPNQPRVLRTGDKLHLGQLILTVIDMS
jgi:pSer/pThr/pTyr-binding forkhead associated (FHA) protein